MTVYELIQKLEKYHPDWEIKCFHDDPGDLDIWYKENYEGTIELPLLK